jgi:DedD protein
MDKALKERIIGAIVLVAVAVLVVPVFLDGPPAGEELISEVVPLPGQSEQAEKTVVLDRDRDEPVPASILKAEREKEAAAASSPSPEPAQPEPAPEVIAEAVATATGTDVAKEEATASAPPPSSVKAAGSTTGMWAVQLGSFSSQENAEKLAADLRKQGFAAFLSQLSTDSGQLHRVRIGPQKDREAAEAMAARLQRAGHTGKVLPHP